MSKRPFIENKIIELEYPLQLKIGHNILRQFTEEQEPRIDYDLS